MAKQTFTAGQVLTATQMNNLQANDYNWTTSAQTSSYVLVAANAGQTVTMTSASATTITVNTGLFAAGDTVRILNLGAGACTITAGTATVNTAGSLILPQYASGTLWFSSASAAIFIPDDRNAGLTLVKTQTIGSAVSSVTVTNAFSATYENYKIIVSGGTASSANQDFTLKLGASTTGYYFQLIYGSYSTSALASGGSNVSSVSYAGIADTNGLAAQIEIQSPFLAKYTTYQAQVSRGSIGGVMTGVHQVATSYTDFVLTVNGAYTITGGTIYVYGYQTS